MSETLATQLILKRSIERTLDNFKKLGKANFTTAKVRSRLSTLKESWSQFRAGHAVLLTTTPAKERASMEYFREGYFEATEDVFTATTDYLAECLEELEPFVSPNTSLNQSMSRSDPAAISSAHMPKINLLPFDGTYSEWETFRDRFFALVIRNNSLSDFARFHYLVSSLTGRASDSIRDISITADNFPLAWQTLHSRFENKRRLIATQFSSILGATAISKESATELQSLCDKFNIAIASLKNLGRTPSELWDDFLVHSLTQRIDPASRKAWNLKTSDSDSPPSYTDLNQFLTSRIRALEDCVSYSPAKIVKAATCRAHAATASTPTSPACPLCQARHYMSACIKFTEKSPAQRREMVKDLHRCLNCLSASHAAPECPSKYSCRSCSQRHHTTLHLDSDSDSNSNKATHCASPVNSPSEAIEVTSLFASATRRPSSCVLLATAQVRIASANGRTVVARALVDQGSEATFVSEALAQTLRAKRLRMPVSISAVGGAQIGTVRQAVQIKVSSINSDTRPLVTTALILPSLTSYAPKLTSEISTFAHLSNLQLADSNPMSSSPIQVLIGADIYGSIIRESIKRGSPDQPIAQNSIFGWILSGPLPSERSSERSNHPLTVHHCASLQTLSDQITRFWAIEDIPSASTLTPSEKQCEIHFCHTHKRDSNGQYVVRLPFKTDPPIDIGHSRQRAERLLRSLSRRLESQTDLKSEYVSFLSEYETLGHMRRVSEGSSSSPQCVYIPHHPVVRADSITTRVRVVFNASSATSNGTSLNDHLLTGPTLQAELPSVILRWRRFRFVYTADIAKMYRQIKIDSRDLDYQRILWHSDPTQISEYQLLTVTYGMACAPYLALRVLRRLAEDDGHRFPLAVPILRHHIYVDDVLFGAHDIPDLLHARDQLILLLRCGHFELRKWANNSEELLTDIDPSNHGLACGKSIETDDSVKILGVSWQPSRDVFAFQVTLNSPIPKSKREFCRQLPAFTIRSAGLPPSQLPQRYSCSNCGDTKLTGTIPFLLPCSPVGNASTRSSTV